MTNNPDIETTWNCRTYAKKVCNKTVYIIINYKNDTPNKIDFIQIHGSSKFGDCTNPFLESIADLLTFSVRRIRNEHEAKAIVKNLRHHKCNQMPSNKDHVSSCVDAVGQVMEEVLLDKIPQ